MPLSIRALSVLALAGALFAILFTKSSAEPPFSRELTFPEDVTLSEEQAVPDGRTNPEGLKSFQDAVEGKFLPGGTGNPILDDVLQVLKEKRSVVDGFPEDPLLRKSDTDRISDEIDATTSRQAVAAEQMLRAARLLEKVSESDADRLALIKRMRSEARRLLAE